MTETETLVAKLHAARVVAEQVVADMPAGALKERAFGVAFHLAALGSPGVSAPTAQRERTKKSRAKARPSKSSESKQPPAARRSGKKGSRVWCRQILKEGFFREERSCDDVVEHLQHAKVAKFPSSEISARLSEMTSKDSLTRRQVEKNGKKIYLFKAP